MKLKELLDNLAEMLTELGVYHPDVPIGVYIEIMNDTLEPEGIFFEADFNGVVDWREEVS